DAAARQAQIAKEVGALTDIPPADRNKAVQDLDARKDALSKDVKAIQSEANRLAAVARTDQGKAAAALESAANQIKSGQIPERIDYSKSLAREAVNQGNATDAKTF